MSKCVLYNRRFRADIPRRRGGDPAAVKCAVMKGGAPGSFGAQLRSLRAAAGFTQEELATIAGLSVHAVSALERGQRRRPHLETVRSLAIALDLPPSDRDALVQIARGATSDSSNRWPLAVAETRWLPSATFHTR